jgi:methionyl-tRNA synthetase
LLFDSEYFTFFWFDALLIYVTGSNFLNDQIDEYWPADIHVIGKDIFVSAHSMYWPIMLHSLWLEPKKFLANGCWLVFDEKMLKSIGNVVGPLNRVSKLGANPVRYHLIRELTVEQDLWLFRKKIKNTL